jgi:hypothetical protein
MSCIKSSPDVRTLNSPNDIHSRWVALYTHQWKSTQILKYYKWLVIIINTCMCMCPPMMYLACDKEISFNVLPVSEVTNYQLI